MLIDIRKLSNCPFLFWLIFFCLLGSTEIEAQDTIVKRNQDVIIAKILEVNPGDVKYKRFDYQEGPTFTVEKSELRYIVFHNKVKESFENFKSSSVSTAFPVKKDLTIQPAGKYYYYLNQQIPEQDMLDIVWKQQDKKLKLLVKKTEELKVLKNSFLAGAIVLGTAGLLTFVGAFDQDISASVGKGAARTARLNERIQDRTVGGYLFLGGVATEAVSYVFHIREIRHAHVVVDVYNQSVSANP